MRIKLSILLLILAFTAGAAKFPAPALADDAPKTDEAPKSDEAPKTDEAPKATETPKDEVQTDNNNMESLFTPDAHGYHPVQKPLTPPPSATEIQAPKDFTPQSDEKAQKFRAESAAKKGSETMKAQNYRQAEAQYKEAAQFDPGNIQYLEQFAIAAHKGNDNLGAVEAFTRLLKADGAHHPEAYFIIAESLYKLHRFDEASEAYKKSVPFEKEKGAIWLKIADIRLLQGKSSDVADAYRNAIKTAPHDGKAYTLLAAMQWHEGNKAESLKTYREGAQSASKDGDLQAAYAYALMDNQQWAEAAKAYKAASMIKGANAAIEQGYQSAMQHIEYDAQMAKRAAEKEEKDKKKHHKS